MAVHDLTDEHRDNARAYTTELRLLAAIAKATGPVHCVGMAFPYRGNLILDSAGE